MTLMNSPISSIYINNQLYVANSTRNDFMNSICQKFETTPHNCVFFNNQYNIQKSEKI